ncbi:MAG: asparaginase domain-containing protein [Spirochaetota bacterium]
MSIRLIVTGGTFDKHYDELNGQLTFRDTHLPEILQAARMGESIEVEINQLVDSLDMGPEDRQRVLESCRRAPEERIIVTHGTDTMAETGRVLGEAGLEKTVVLTGAMVPYAVQRSDAVFNFGFSVAAVQLLPAGVYVAMNGRVFPWDDVRKNKAKGQFERAGENPGAGAAQG